MDTEFGESIKENGGEYKYITPVLRVYTDGGLASYNANEKDWEDAKVDYQGYVKYFDSKTRKCVIERNAYLVALAFLPNPNKLKKFFHKDEKEEVEKLEEGILRIIENHLPPHTTKGELLNYIRRNA